MLRVLSALPSWRMFIDGIAERILAIRHREVRRSIGKVETKTGKNVLPEDLRLGASPLLPLDRTRWSATCSRQDEDQGHFAGDCSAFVLRCCRIYRQRYAQPGPLGKLRRFA